MEKELKLTTQYGEQKEVKFEISRYLSNNCIYIGLLTKEEDGFEPYGNVTVNMRGKVPDYCGYVDTNSMPELEEFLVHYGIGTFTGLTQQSGFCTYPLYRFDADTLRNLCPKGMAEYERSIQKDEKIIVEKGWSR